MKVDDGSCSVAGHYTLLLSSNDGLSSLLIFHLTFSHNLIKILSMRSNLNDTYRNLEGQKYTQGGDKDIYRGGGTKIYTYKYRGKLVSNQPKCHKCRSSVCHGLARELISRAHIQRAATHVSIHSHAYSRSRSQHSTPKQRYIHILTPHGKYTSGSKFLHPPMLMSH